MVHILADDPEPGKRTPAGKSLADRIASTAAQIEQQATALDALEARFAGSYSRPDIERSPWPSLAARYWSYAAKEANPKTAAYWIRRAKEAAQDGR